MSVSAPREELRDAACPCVMISRIAIGHIYKISFPLGFELVFSSEKDRSGRGSAYCRNRENQKCIVEARIQAIEQICRRRWRIEQVQPCANQLSVSFSISQCGCVCFRDCVRFVSACCACEDGYRCVPYVKTCEVDSRKAGAVTTPRGSAIFACQQDPEHEQGKGRDTDTKTGPRTYDSHTRFSHTVRE